MRYNRSMLLRRGMLSTIVMLFACGGHHANVAKQPLANHGPQTAPATTVGDAGVAAAASDMFDPNTGFDVISDPAGAHVALDGLDIGTAPLRVRSLVTGAHELVVTADGYQPNSQVISVVLHEAPEIQVSLAPRH